MKKLLALLLSILMLFSLVGCSGNKPSGGPGEKAEFVDGKYTAPVTITQGIGTDAAVRFFEGESYDENVWTKLIKDTYNIDMEVAWTADANTEAYGNKVNMSIASGELPDITMVQWGSYVSAAKAGLLVDIEPYIEQYGSPELKETLANNKQIIDTMRIDGHLYAIPQLGSDWRNNAMMWFVRTDWLEKLGLEMPTTWDELLTVARAFRDQDPDGNGVNDTYGIGLANDLWWSGGGSFAGIASAFHAYGLDVWVERDGKKVYSGILPEMKDALTAAHELYTEGLIDPEFGTKDQGAVTADVLNNKIGIVAGQNWLGFWPLADILADQPEATFMPFQFVSADDREAEIATWWPVNEYYIVAKTCEHPEAAVLIANLYIDTINSSSDPETIRVYDNDGDVNNYLLSPVRVGAPDMIGREVRLAQKFIDGIETADLNPFEQNYVDLYNAYKGGDNSYFGYYSQYAYGDKYKGAFEVIIEDYLAKDRMKMTVVPVIPDELTAEWNLILASEVEYFVKAISGAVDINNFETEWVQQFTNLGGDRVTEAVNK